MSREYFLGFFYVRTKLKGKFVAQNKPSLVTSVTLLK
jgi:hypothetical protein